jgi:DNA-binding beta-propeller fold protein YncE
VHSAKFPNEREAASLRLAIRRHQITHPVVNDADFVVWQRYGVRAWPTLVLIDPQGYVVEAVAAGCHQVWSLELSGGRLDLVCGTGRESLVDGPRLEAAMNQPSRIATDASQLYVADSEASAIRVIDPRPGGRIRTLVGVGLFDFGDRDGTGTGVRLQHPLGVAVLDGRVYIADTYNHKIKVLYPSLQRVESLFGTGRPGEALGDRPQFFEPGGLAAARGRLYIADTNNQRICVADLTTGSVTALSLPPL